YSLWTKIYFGPSDIYYSGTDVLRNKWIRFILLLHLQEEDPFGSFLHLQVGNALLTEMPNEP
ncbi:MAG: hypothetical protein AAFO96_27275, partial [Bacteroidota bacterium]